MMIQNALVFLGTDQVNGDSFNRPLFKQVRKNREKNVLYLEQRWRTRKEKVWERKES